MRYMLLLYGDETQGNDLTPEQWNALIEAHNTFSAEAREKGYNPTGEALHPTAMAQTIRFEDGHATLTVNGPFAETREQLGGFYLLDCNSIEEALEMASKLPVGNGSVEVRPVVEFD